MTVALTRHVVLADGPPFAFALLFEDAKAWRTERIDPCNLLGALFDGHRTIVALTDDLGGSPQRS